MDELRWIEWLLRVAQDEIQPAVAGAVFTGPAFFQPGEKWAKTAARWVSPVRAWAQARPAAELDRYRRELTRFFAEQIPNLSVPRDPRHPKPLSDSETLDALHGMWSILTWLQRPKNQFGIFGQWRILSRKRINPDAGQLYYGTDLHGRPFVRVEYYDRGLRVIERFARLVATHWPRIRQCDNGKCGRIFVAVKRQINCSIRCQNLKGQRAYRERLGANEQKRAERRLSQKAPTHRRRPLKALPT